MQNGSIYIIQSLGEEKLKRHHLTEFGKPLAIYLPTAIFDFAIRPAAVGAHHAGRGQIAGFACATAISPSRLHTDRIMSASLAAYRAGAIPIQTAGDDGEERSPGGGNRPCIAAFSASDFGPDQATADRLHADLPEFIDS